MWKVLARLLLWPLTLVGALLAGAFFLIQQEPVQQAVAKRALKILNRKIAGSIDVKHVSLKLHGAVNVDGFVLRDADGDTIATARRIDAWLAPWDILRGRVHVLKADIEGLNAVFAMDSSGNNFAGAFATIPSQPADSMKSPLWVRLDRLHMDLDSLYVQVDTSFTKSFIEHAVEADVLLTDSVITYALEIVKETDFRLSSEGVVRVNSDSLFAGEVHFDGSSAYVRDNWAPDLPDLGRIELSAKADVFTRDLVSLFKIELSKVGSLGGDIEIDDFAGRPRVSLGATFTNIDLSAWIGDSVAHQFNGRVAVVKSESQSWLYDWTGRVELDSSFYDSIGIDAELETELFANSAALAGEIRTNAGQFDVRLFCEGLSPDSLSLYGRAVLSNAKVHELVAAVPDSLSPLSGTAEFSLTRVVPDELELDAVLALGPLSLGRYKLDSLALHAAVHGTEFTLDSTRLRLGSAHALLAARGDYTKSITTEVSAEIPAVEEFRDLLRPYLPQVDSLAGGLSVSGSGELSIADDSLSNIVVRGQLSSEKLVLGNTTTHNLLVDCTIFDLNGETIAAGITCDSVLAAGETITPFEFKLKGNWLSPEFACSFAARADTLQVSANGSANFTTEPYSVDLDELELNLFNTVWTNDFPVAVSFDSLHYEIEALILRSDYGVLRATGYLEIPGEQDLVIEFSGFRTGALSPILRTEIPDGRLNVRLQVSGRDTAVIGRVELVIDSVTYKSAHLADEIRLNADLGADGTLDARLLYQWYGDTAAIAAASLPASFSMENGLRIPEGEELAGTLQIDSLPLQRFAPWMSAGTLLDGFLSANLILKGSALEPDWDGEVHLDDGFYRDTRFGIAYKWIVLDADLRRDSLLINSLRATSRGTMTGSGFARLGVPWPEELDMELKFDRFEAVSSRIQKARLDGDLALNGPFDSLHAAGRLTVQEGLYRLTQSATKTIEPVNMDSVLAVLRGDSLEEGFNTDALYQSMSLDLNVEIPGNFWIRGAGLNTELFGELRLEKDHFQDATANGEIAVRNGTVNFYGQELRITDNSSFRFDGPVDSPELNVSAVYTGVERERGYEVTVKLTGTPDKSLAEFSGKFDDGTVMSEDEAIQRLLPFANVGDGSGFDAEQSVVDAASGQVSDIVSKASGLDVFEFRPGPGGLSDLSSGQLELGTYVTDRLFIRVFQPIEDPRAGQKVSIDYRLLDWMKLTAEQESRSQATTSSSFTVYLQFEWR